MRVVVLYFFFREELGVLWLYLFLLVFPSPELFLLDPPPLATPEPFDFALDLAALDLAMVNSYFYCAPTGLQKKERIKDYAVRQVIWENKKIRPAVTFLIPGYGSASLRLSILFCQHSCWQTR